MDLINSKNELDLNDDSWKIYTEDTTVLPQYVGPTAEIERALSTREVRSMEKSKILYCLQVQESAKVHRLLTVY